MLKFFSRKKNEDDKSAYSRLVADMHSHLIPGIDDGAPDLATSLKLIRGMTELGFSKLITTPHIMWDIYKNSREKILERADRLRDAVNKEGIPVEIHAAAEYFLDDHVAGLIKNNEPLLTISGKSVLVEFSLAYPSHSLKSILFDMQMQGYQPVIAHPERYIYLQQNKEFYEELKEIGCLFQLNLMALNGHYGRSVQELAQYLIRKNHYELIGTDLHHARHLEELKSPALIQSLRKLLDTGNFRNATL